MIKSFFATFLSTLLILLFASVQGISQPAPQGEPIKLIEQPDIQFMNPVWSPDGNSIAFTSLQYRGLWIADNSGNNLRKITDETAGYGFSWSMDSGSLLSRVSTTENRRRKLAVKIFHTDNQEPTQVTDFRNDMPAIPTWANYDQNVVLITDRNIEAFESEKEVPDRFKQQVNQEFYVLNTNKIATGKVPENSTEDISPFEDATYLNLQVSPDGRKLAFEVYGGNMYVMNIDGSNLIDLGQANRPRWSPGSDYVVAMVAQDDGHNYTKSDLYAFSVDGNERINLTASTDMIAMNPDWSPVGDKIAFDTPEDGAIYILNITQ